MKPLHWPIGRPRWVVLAVLLGILASLLLALTVFAAKVSPPPPDKQTRVQQLLAAQETAANSPHAPKHPQPTFTPTTSCPLPPGIQTEIVPRSLIDGATARDVLFMNGASIAPSPKRPFEYLIYAGAYRANPQQGILIVERFDQDPCVPGAPASQFNRYPTPFQQGAVTITQIVGDTVTFTTAVGGSGTFNYVTGQFS